MGTPGFLRQRSGRSGTPSPNPRWLARGAYGATVILQGLRALVFLSVVLRCAAADGDLPPGALPAAVEQYLAKQDEVKSNDLALVQMAANFERTASFEAMLAERVQEMEQCPELAASQPLTQTHLAWATLVALTVILSFRRLAPWLVTLIFRRLDPWRALPAAAGTGELSAEDPAWLEFLHSMRGDPKTLLAQISTGPVDPEAKDPALAPDDESTARFLESAPKQLATVRALFSDIARAGDNSNRHANLQELFREVQSLRDGACSPELLPVSQLTSALQGLLSQLSLKPAGITGSTLRTAAAAVDLLGKLCVRGVKPHLATEPPVRLLAVDDDLLIRNLMSRALQKAFNEPDLAVGGVEALAFAATQTYDLIFLDVEMPGMDGFELCKRLHETPLNSSTPVIFVTRHSEFDSRAKSTLLGAEDLMAKPFLAFEIALKALTLVMRARLTKACLATQSPTQSVPARARQVETTGTIGHKAPLPKLATQPLLPALVPPEPSQPKMPTGARKNRTAKQHVPASAMARAGAPGAPAKTAARPHKSRHATSHPRVQPKPTVPAKPVLSRAKGFLGKLRDQLASARGRTRSRTGSTNC